MLPCPYHPSLSGLSSENVSEPPPCCSFGSSNSNGSSLPCSRFTLLHKNCPCSEPAVTKKLKLSPDRCEFQGNRRHLIASANSSKRPLWVSSTARIFATFNGTPDEFLSPIPRINRRLYGGRGPQAASEAGVPLESNVELFEQKAVYPASFFLSQRIKVVAMVSLAMALCNVDRVVMSVAIVRLQSIFNWSTTFSGVVQSSFLWGYAISPIVGGALVDHYGGKRVMSCGVALWSLATILTPWAAKHSLHMLLAMRVLMGLAEGVAMPSMNNMITRWFPRSERATAVGLSMAGFHMGSVMGLLATPLIMARFGLFTPFTTFGLVGFAWLFFWVTFISKDPETHPSIEASELLYIQQGNRGLTKSSIAGPGVQTSGKFPPFNLLLAKLPTWAIIVANAMHNWGYFILLSWMPIYFNTVIGVNLKEAAWFSALPWAMMAALGFVAGKGSDSLIQSGLCVTTVRKIMQSIGFLGPAIALLGVNTSQNANVAAAWLTVAVGLSSFSQAGFLVNFQEIAPRYAGVLHGMANTAGTMAAIVSTIGTGFFVERLGSFQAFLTLTAALYVICTIFWNCCATGERVFQ